MTQERTRTVLDVLIRGFSSAVFLLVATLISDPPLPKPSEWSSLPSVVSSSSKLPVSKAPQALIPPLPVPQAPALALTFRPPPVTWGTSPRNVTGIMERLRAEVGSDVSPWDFSGPGTIDDFWTWIGVAGPTTPIGMKATVKSVATPFGKSTNLNLFLTSGDAQWAISLLSQSNTKGYFPALNLELYEFPFQVAGNPVLISPRMSLWAQPQHQLADSSVWNWGGLWQVSFEVPLDESFGLWVEGSGKTEGWAPGIEETSAGWSLRSGVHWLF